jgi:hypothetical protein
VPAWAKEPEKPTYTADEVGAVPIARKIADIDLEDDITVEELQTALGVKEVDQTFDRNSKNAQSGIAVNEAVGEVWGKYRFAGNPKTYSAFRKMIDGKQNGYVYNFRIEGELSTETLNCDNDCLGVYRDGFGGFYFINLMSGKCGKIYDAHGCIGYEEFGVDLDPINTALADKADKSDIPDVSAYQTAEQVATAIDEALGVIENGTY